MSIKSLDLISPIIFSFTQCLEKKNPKKILGLLNNSKHFPLGKRITKFTLTYKQKKMSAPAYSTE
jgi:hypothetical protein